jgi:hypothetical protein
MINPIRHGSGPSVGPAGHIELFEIVTDGSKLAALMGSTKVQVR